jgi:hypothetical protein
MPAALALNIHYPTFDFIADLDPTLNFDAAQVPKRILLLIKMMQIRNYCTGLQTFYDSRV